MSMEVDYTTPLTDDERAYLMSRGRYADVERADNAHGTTGDAAFYAGDGTGLREQQVMSGEVAARRKEALLAELAAIEAAEGSSDTDEEDEVPPYEAWKVQELDTELRRRNLPVTGDKAAKAKALYDNDAAEEQARHQQ